MHPPKVVTHPSHAYSRRSRSCLRRRPPWPPGLGHSHTRHFSALVPQYPPGSTYSNALRRSGSRRGATRAAVGHHADQKRLFFLASVWIFWVRVLSGSAPVALSSHTNSALGACSRFLLGWCCGDGGVVGVTFKQLLRA